MDPLLFSVGTGIAANAAWATFTMPRIFSLNARLTGRWEGDLTCPQSTDPDVRGHVIHCIIVLARPANRQNSGLLYYRRHDPSSGKNIVEGVDELHDLQKCPDSTTKEFIVAFTRRLHKYADNRIDTSDTKYAFRSRLDSNKLYATTEIPNCSKAHDTWEGCFHKQ